MLGPRVLGANNTDEERRVRGGPVAASASRRHPSGFHDGRMLLTVAGKDKFVQKHLDSF